MRIILIYLARACRAIADRHVDAAEAWQARAAMLEARAGLTVTSDNIAKCEPYDPAKHGEVRK